VAVRVFEQQMLCQRISDQRIFRDEREIGKLIAMGEEGDGALSEVRNSRAVTITKRVQDKLTGRDFDNDAEPLDIDSQARRLTRCRCQCFSHALSAGRPSHIRGHFGGQSQPSASLLLACCCSDESESHADCCSATLDGARSGDCICY